MLLSVKVDLLIYFLKKTHIFFLIWGWLCIPPPCEGLVDLAESEYLFHEWCCQFKLLRGIFLRAVSRGAEWQQGLLQSLSRAQHMIPRRWWDEVCEWDWKLGSSSPLQHWLLLPDPRCILPNKCFSSLRSSDYTLHWIQIKRQNVSLISTVMWDR